jgi:tetratricopeptide (TPR) repeat protein
LADYDSLRAIERASDRARGRPDATPRKEARIERLLFQLDSLQDPPARLALRAYLKPDFAAAWRCQSEGIGSDVLNRLAKAEYASGEQAIAYQHWQVLLLQGNLDAEPYLHAFTSLLQQHPGQPDLLLCRAIAHVVHAADYYGQPARPLSAAALRDLQAAARLRPHDFWVPYFRAKVYEAAGQLPQAVAELGRAIAENATLPALHRYRHELRAMLH